MDNRRNGARVLTQPEQFDLEQLLDKTSLASIVEALADIARDKAGHMRYAWQDEKNAVMWEQDAEKLDRLADIVKNF